MNEKCIIIYLVNYILFSKMSSRLHHAFVRMPLHTILPRTVTVTYCGLKIRAFFHLISQKISYYYYYLQK